MFIFPIRTDRRLKRTPVVNYALIAVNVAIHLLIHLNRNTFQVQALTDAYLLHPTDPRLYQFITYQFLHAGWMHLLGNMIFLYVFGNSLEDRLGRIGYLAFYLSGGVIAGVGHAMWSVNPVLGASGAISAVTGAYLALFPMSNVTIFFWFFFYIDTFEVSSFVLIGFQIAENVVFQFGGSGGVAYLAHLAGYAFGFTVGMGLLRFRLLPREPYDMLTLMEHRRRRAQFRAMARQGYRPWEKESGGQTGGRGRKKAVAVDPRVAELRATVAEAVADHDLLKAATAYGELLAVDADQVLSQQVQLDVANQMMSQGHHEFAARAYELFLKTYHAYPQREQVQLILGLIYARYLKRADRAVELLTAALNRLHDAQQKDLAQRTLDELAPSSSSSG